MSRSVSRLNVVSADVFVQKMMLKKYTNTEKKNTILRSYHDNDYTRPRHLTKLFIIRPFLTCEAAQILVQALIVTPLDYCNSLLTGLPASAIKPLQRIQNTAANWVITLPKVSQVTPLFRDLHWFPIIARIRFKTLVLAHKAVSGTAPTYLQTVRLNDPARVLHSTTLPRLLVPPSRRTGNHPAKSQLNFVLAPYWWNELPSDVRTAVSHQLPQETEDPPVQSSPGLGIYFYFVFWGR